MVRRRTAVPIAAAALLLASPALTACGSGPAQPGAAAVVGGQKITVSTLEGKVNELRAAQAASPQGDQMVAASGKLPTQTLNMLVQSAVIERAAAKAGVTVSDDEVQQQHAAALQQFGSEQALDAALLQQADVVPAGADGYFRTNTLVGKLIMSLGFQPGSDGGQTAVIDAISKAADGLGVKINPRYGAWDSKKAVIGDATDPWVVTKTPSAPAAPAA